MMRTAGPQGSRWPSALALAVVLVLGGACQKKDAGSPKVASPSTQAAAPPPPKSTLAPPVLATDASPLAPATLGAQLYIGEIAPLSMIDLMSSVGGRLAFVYKRLGDEVKKGEVVAAMDDEEIRKQLLEGDVAVQAAQAQVARAKTEVVRVRAEITRAEVELRRVKREHDRNKPLVERRVIAEAAWDQLASGLEAAQAAVGAARAGEPAAESVLAAARVAVKQAEARIATGKVSLRNARVRSPFAGRVNMRYLDPGAFLVNMNPRPILQIVSTEDLVVRFKVPERDLAAVHAGNKVDVRVDAFPDQVFPATVARIGAALESATRAIQLEATIDSAGGRLKPGMFARISVDWRRTDTKAASADDEEEE